MQITHKKACSMLILILNINNMYFWDLASWKIVVRPVTVRRVGGQETRCDHDDDLGLSPNAYRLRGYAH